MKTINKRKIPKKFIAISGTILLLAIGGSLTYVYAFNGNLFGWHKLTTVNTDNNQNPINYNPATPEQQNAGTTVKSDSNSTSPTQTTVPGNSKKNIQITITAANQNGPTLQIRALISAVENTGTCTLTLTSLGQATVTKTADAQALASTSTCQGFDVPVSELSIGSWHADISYSSPTMMGSSSTDIVIK